MNGILLATDSDTLFRSVDAALTDDTTLWRVRRGSDVVTAVNELDPEIVLLDLQIGNMGGIAAAIAVRQEEGAGRLDRRKVALLLDREDDRFLANEAKADAAVTKPLSALALRRLISDLQAAPSAAASHD